MTHFSNGTSARAGNLNSHALSCMTVFQHMYPSTPELILEGKGIAGNKIMTWPAKSPDLNPIDNLCTTIKRRVYLADKQYTSQEQLWEAIKDVSAALEPQEIQNHVEHG